MPVYHVKVYNRSEKDSLKRLFPESRISYLDCTMADLTCTPVPLQLPNEVR